MSEINSNNDRNIVKKVRSKLFVGILLASVLIGILAVVTENVRAETWSIETVDSAGDVGHDTSIALDSKGYPHISYRDHTNKDLKYARWNGRMWNIETVDSADYVVKYTSSIALDSDDHPHISYLDFTHGNLMYARWTRNDWVIEIVDSAYKVGSYTSIALDGSDYPHISYRDYTNGDLKYAKCDGRTWENETVDSAGDVGLSTSIALDSKGHPHISYRDYTNKDLKYAKWDGRTWDIETVDSAGDVGYATSIALDSNDHPHISYRDYTTDKLKYARWTEDDWDIETVDYVGDIDFSTSIALGSNDHPHISYLDLINDDLKYARWTGDDWDIETVDSAYKVGSYPSMALDSNDYPHISYRDYTNGDLKYAKLAATVPTPPRNLQATASDGSVNLKWTAPSDEGGSPITKYSIYRGTTSGGGTLQETVSNVLSYTDDNVIDNLTYYYQVSAENSIGKGERSDEKFVRLIPGRTVPSAPLNFKASADDGNVRLEWREPSDEGGSPITNYNIYRGKAQGEETLQKIVSNVLSYTDDNVIDNLTYYYQVSAENSIGEGERSDEKIVTLITVPSAPLNFKVTPDDGNVNLEWREPSDYGGSPITNYNIYRGKAQGEETLQKTVSNVLSYTDDNVIDNLTYYYQVSAENSIGKGERSDEKFVTLIPGRTVPSKLLNFIATLDDGYVRLEWREPSDDGGSPITNYKLYRGKAQGEETLLWHVGNDVLTYIDTDVINDQTYYYQVSAENAIGEGERSDERVVNQTGDTLDMSVWITIIIALIGALGVIAAALINYLSSKKRK